MNRELMRPLALFLAMLFAAALLAPPALAITAKEKRETCQFGAADQKLTGAKQKAFIAQVHGQRARAGQGKEEERRKEELSRGQIDGR